MRLFALVSGLIFVMAAAHAEPVALQSTKPIYQWKTESNNDDKGFDHCLVKNMYDNGTMMILAENRDGVTRLALHFPQDKMQPNQQYDLTIQIDKRDVFPVDAVAINSQVMTIGIPEALPDQMRKGNVLHLRGPSDEVVFLLDGMDGAVAALRDCVTTNKNLAEGKKPTMAQVPDDLLDDDTAAAPVAVPTEKVASAMPTLPVAGEKAVKEDKPEAKKQPVAVAEKQPEPPPVPQPLLPTDLNEIMRRAGVAPTMLLMSKPGAAGNKPLDYAWQQQGLFIGAKQEKAAGDLNASATAYMRGLRATCAGEFVAEASVLQKNKALSWIVAEVACAPRKGASTIGALLFFNNGKNLTIAFVEGPATDGAHAIKVRNAILKASADVLK